MTYMAIRMTALMGALHWLYLCVFSVYGGLNLIVILSVFGAGALLTILFRRSISAKKAVLILFLSFVCAVLTLRLSPCVDEFVLRMVDLATWVAGLSDGHFRGSLQSGDDTVYMNEDGSGLFVGVPIVVTIAMIMISNGSLSIWSRIILPILALACSAITEFLRYIVMYLLSVELDWISLMWNPISVVASYLAIWVISMLLPMPRDGAKIGSSERTSIYRNYIVAVLACVGLVGLYVSLFSYQDTTISRPGMKILINDNKSNWAWASREFIENADGYKSNYNYTGFVDLLSLRHTVTVNKSNDLDRVDLANYDTVILKTPTSSYSLEEIDAIRAYVKSGGHLVVIGDHTNLQGSSTYLNALLEDANIEFNNDDQFCLITGQPTNVSEYINNQLSLCQESVPYLTSCTLKVHPVYVALHGRGMGREKGEYSHVHFFGNMKIDPGDSWGAFPQGAVVPYGSGRITAFTDSTILSNFWVFQNRMPTFAFALVEHDMGLSWLDRNRVALYCISVGVLVVSVLWAIIAPVVISWTWIIPVLSVVILSVIHHVLSSDPIGVKSMDAQSVREGRYAVLDQASSDKTVSMLDYSPVNLANPMCYDVFKLQGLKRGVLLASGVNGDFLGRSQYMVSICPEWDDVESNSENKGDRPP